MDLEKRIENEIGDIGVFSLEIGLGLRHFFWFLPKVIEHGINGRHGSKRL